MSLDEKKDKKDKKDKLSQIENTLDAISNQIDLYADEKRTFDDRSKQCELKIRYLSAQLTIVNSDKCIAMYGDHDWFKPFNDDSKEHCVHCRLVLYDIVRARRTLAQHKAMEQRKMSPCKPVQMIKNCGCPDENHSTALENEHEQEHDRTLDCSNEQCPKRLMQQRLKAHNIIVERTLAEEGLCRIPIQADNNCQFRALAAFSNDPNVNHRSVRQGIVLYIYENKDQFRLDVVEGLGYPSIEQYCSEMWRPGTWGDGVTLTAYCLSKNVNIVVFTEGGRTELYPGDNRPRWGLVCVGEHYEATYTIPKNENFIVKKKNK